ncbi:UDP-2,4-diacetamido-2,4,6-trideoxy-beta-L-altropyranose hydrolase [Spirosoma rhododendri]|uniref:UDP-2,4-diacetamido-2,4, 6-trideoxy-beta-L-altropyranose hydrolase n=1 Tax=Spirosoma rhododendri TaxID=2728024 RepID=A0A7L5DHI2_9BACT|nr:UDP-2,4-diacetamido-2,4,6-trideoxy-beta-L-altropyranose hydrolase [Spirosoma rhododendri]QJD77475.1 UDP-2,4-diacetamido-2,4,6-trideoxy-beta-L-altropyranose hydrolase [Spirosoma rhododendri]
MNRIIFRADADSQIGLGHVMRCLALADMLGSSVDRYMAITEPEPVVQTRLEQAGLQVIALKKNSIATDFLTLLEPSDQVVLDGYSFDSAFQRAVKKRVKRLFFIDDLLDGRQIADVIINHAGGVSPTDYDAGPNTTFCLGPHYALLRSPFLKPGGFGPPPSDGPYFVSLGGADPSNVSLSVVQAIQQLDPKQVVRLVLGPLYAQRDSIDALRTNLPNLTILENLSAEEMVAELERCSLAITACSTIAYEVCAVNRPLIGILTADNQDRIARFLSDEKLALSVHFPHLLSQLDPSISLETVLKLAIQSIQFTPEQIDESLANQRRYFDGKSPERFRALFS